MSENSNGPYKEDKQGMDSEYIEIRGNMISIKQVNIKTLEDLKRKIG